MNESHHDEYHDDMIAMLELIWGVGFMTPGGAVQSSLMDTVTRGGSNTDEADAIWEIIGSDRESTL